MDDNLDPERILELSERLSTVAGASIGEIAAINREAKMLAINALVTAARAGDAGKGFAIVSEEFRRISSNIDEVTQALQSKVTATGDDFVACDVTRAPALDNAPVATYAAAIRRKGASNGQVLGVLGIHFDWMPQAHAVVDGVRLTADERARSRVMLLDQSGRILASSDRRGELDEIVKLPADIGEMGSYADRGVTVGYALTPGYETYRGMGWYGCIAQKESRAATAAPSASAA